VQLRRRDWLPLLSATESSFATRHSKGKIEAIRDSCWMFRKRIRLKTKSAAANRELNALNAMA